MPRPHLTLLMIAALAACGPRRAATRDVSAPGTPADIEGVARLALSLDAAGSRAGDTLYASDAIVIRNAQIRLAAPRFAGISPGATGRVTISATSVTMASRVAWVLVDYRWTNAADRRIEAGRATFICEQRGGSWKIVHAHSSQLLPWDS